MRTASATATLSATATPLLPPQPTATRTQIRFYQQPEVVQERGLYPNPFRNTLHVYFTLRVDALVEFSIYNVAGEIVYRSLSDGRAGPNEILWAGINEVGGRCASGVYLLHLNASGVDATRGDFWDLVVIAR